MKMKRFLNFGLGSRLWFGVPKKQTEASIMVPYQQRFTHLYHNWYSKVEKRKKNWIACLIGATAYGVIPAQFVPQPLVNNNHKNYEPDDPRLKTAECLKNAAGMATDSSCAVMSQTVYAVLKIEEEYQDLLDLMVKLLEAQMNVLGHNTEEEKIADIILETRREVEQVKQRKEELGFVFSSAEKLADATAEVAFAVGMEFASTSTGERLYHCQQEVKRSRARSENAERRLTEIEVRVIEAITKKAEKKDKKEDEEDDDTKWK